MNKWNNQVLYLFILVQIHCYSSSLSHVYILASQGIFIHSLELRTKFLFYFFSLRSNPLIIETETLSGRYIFIML